MYLGDIYLTKAGEKDWTKVEVESDKSIDGIFNSGFPSGFVAFAPQIVEAIREGQPKIEHTATFEDGLKVQKILDAARLSDSTGSVVRV